MPFVPSIPEDQFILVEEGDPTVIPCRTSDPDAQVTLVNSLDKPVYALYDTKQGFIGNFPAGSYTCKTMVKGVEFKSDEFLIYIIRGIYFCSLKKKRKSDCALSSHCKSHISTSITGLYQIFLQ